MKKLMLTVLTISLFSAGSLLSFHLQKSGAKFNSPQNTPISSKYHQVRKLASPEQGTFTLGGMKFNFVEKAEATVKTSACGGCGDYCKTCWTEHGQTTCTESIVVCG